MNKSVQSDAYNPVSAVPQQSCDLAVVVSQQGSPAATSWKCNNRFHGVW